MITCVAFDFDGTLVDSNAIKRNGFFAVTKEFEGAGYHLNAILEEFGTATRHEIFVELARRLPTGDRPGPSLSDGWVRAYSIYCEEAIVAAPEIAGALACLASWRDAGAKLYVNSATPEDALAALVSRRNLSRWFDGVFGAPASKVENLVRIRKDAGCEASQMLFIGDGAADREAADAFGCRFAHVGPSGLVHLRSGIDCLG